MKLVMVDQCAIPCARSLAPGSPGTVAKRGQRSTDVTLHLVMRIAYVVGARPNFVKTAPVIAELRRRLPDGRHALIDTGQDYDRLMSDIVREELGVPAPDHRLGVGGLWTLVVSHWSNSEADRLFVGDGLRSVERIQEQTAVKKAFVAQSDLVGVLVELGVLGLLAWLLMWLTIIKSGIDWIILLPLATYALINGPLEYAGAIVFGIALAGACISSSRSRQDARRPHQCGNLSQSISNRYSA